MSQKRHQACDACKQRKVKCNGEPVCQQCKNFELKCVYTISERSSKIKRKRSKRGQVIALYKKSSEENTFADQSEEIQSTRKVKTENFEDSLRPQFNFSNNKVFSTEFDQNFFTGVVDTYMNCLYPMFPIISAAEVRRSIDLMYKDRQHAAFLHAMAAVSISNKNNNIDSATTRLCSKLLSGALELRGPILPGTKISITTIMASVCMSSSLVSFHSVEIAWLYLREAITMAIILKIADKTSLEQADLVERSRQQRLHWMLYIHERFLGVHYYRPAAFAPLSDLPERDPSLPKGVHEGFLQIIKLFSLIDGKFIKARLGDYSEITQNWIEAKQRELEASDEEMRNFNEMQRADLIVTQQWLKMLVWQMAMSRHLLSSRMSKDFMSLLFPVRLSRQLRTLINTTSSKSIAVHGSAIMHKMLELSLTIADVIVQIPADSLEETADRIDDYMWIAKFLIKQNINKAGREILQEKLAIVERAYSKIVVSDARSYSLSPPPISNNNSSSDHGNSISDEDPWLALSQSFNTPIIEEASPSSSTSSASVSTSLHHQLGFGLGNDRPLVPDLHYLSESSQDLLNEIELTFL